MIPIFNSGRATPVSHGHLTSVWPGGLVKPRGSVHLIETRKSRNIQLPDGSGTKKLLHTAFYQSDFFDKIMFRILSDLHRVNYSDNVFQHSVYDYYLSYTI